MPPVSSSSFHKTWIQCFGYCFVYFTQKETVSPWFSGTSTTTPPPSDSVCHEGLIPSRHMDVPQSRPEEQLAGRRSVSSTWSRRLSFPATHREEYRRLSPFVGQLAAGWIAVNVMSRSPLSSSKRTAPTRRQLTKVSRAHGEENKSQDTRPPGGCSLSFRRGLPSRSNCKDKTAGQSALHCALAPFQLQEQNQIASLQWTGRTLEREGARSFPLATRRGARPIKALFMDDARNTRLDCPSCFSPMARRTCAFLFFDVSQLQDEQAEGRRLSYVAIRTADPWTWALGW